MGEFRMPSLGADMESGTITEWRVQPGDAVRRGDIVAVVDTDKSTIEVEVFEDGEIAELLVEPGHEVPVGTVLARITPATTAGRPAEKVPHGTEPEPPSPEPPSPEPPSPVVEVPDAGGHGAGGHGNAAGEPFVRASPLARRRAAAGGVDLASFAASGSGPGGAVLAGDVGERGAGGERPSAASRRATPEPGRRGDRGPAMRRAIGSLMARSKREIPHYYLGTTVDLAGPLDWLARANSSRPVTSRLLPAALLLKATALACRDVPVMNGWWEGDFRPSDEVHLGVAVSLRGGGLVAPAIHGADALGLDALMEALRDVVGRARAGVLRSSEMTDPTITVTNLGDQGVEEVFGVIYPPQVALVGFGRIVDRPWAVDGALTVRPVVRATLAADHRASDGHDGARFLAAVDRHLQSPEAL